MYKPRIRRRTSHHALRGQGLAEYALTILLVAVVGIFVLGLIGLGASRIFGVVAGIMGANRNGSVSDGGIIEIQQAYCHVVPPTNISFCPDSAMCGKTTLQVVGLFDNSVKGATDLTISTDQQFADSITTNGVVPNSFAYTHIISQTSDSSACPRTVVVQSVSRKVTAIVPVTVFQYPN